MDPQQRITEIEAEFAAKIESAPAEQRVELQLAREQAKNAVYAEYQQNQVRAEHVAAALKEFPHAPPTAVGGSTREEIFASAKGLHDHYAALVEQTRAAITAEIEQKTKQQFYGRPTAGGGQTDIDGAGGGLTATETPLEHLIDHVEGVLHNRTGVITPDQHDALVMGIGDTLIQRQLHRELPDGLEEKGGIRR